MFEGIGRSGSHSGRDEFGDRYKVSRRANGRFKLSRNLRDEPARRQRRNATIEPFDVVARVLKIRDEGLHV